MRKLFTILAAVVVLISCETEVNPELDTSLNILVIDAWLTDNDPVQHINITRSQPYFDASVPPKVAGATVTITDLDDPSTVYTFTEREDRYTWESGDGTTLGVVGHNYELTVEIDGNIYRSTTSLEAVPPIDSFRFRLEEGNAFFDDLIFAEFFATDLPGINDTYWIKAWKNDKFLGKPDEINVAYDAAFSVDIDNDGVQFIQPIRDGVNPFEVTRDEDILSPYALPASYPIEGNIIRFPNDPNSVWGRIVGDSIIYESALVPEDVFSDYIDNDRFTIRMEGNGQFLDVKGDSLYVEIHSISNEAYFFLNQVIEETNRTGGFGALFATPLSNVNTNIFPDNENINVMGFFNIASVSRDGTRLVDEDQVRVLE